MLKIANRGQLLEAVAVLVCFAMLLASVAMLPTANSETGQAFTLPCQIATYGDVWNGTLAFGLFQTNSSNPSQALASRLVVMSTDGQVQYLRETLGEEDYWAVKNIAPGVLMFQGEPTVAYGNSPLAATHFWNYAANTTQDFPNVVSHHDIEYDPATDTFMTLQAYIRQVGDNSILYDKIVKVDANGSALWSWDTYDHIPLSEASPFNETAVVNGQTVEDFTHANALQWDYQNGVVYLNLRHTNTFYKINQTSGEVIWACGQFGNFTLLDAAGNNVTSLWYHCHDTIMIAPDKFILFDNDYANVTDPTDSRSRLTIVTLNEADMTARISWTWEAPLSLWSPYWGSAMVLPNGDVMGVFGTPTHAFPQNGAGTFNDTGAVIVEVNPAGQVVRTYTFPVGWGIYRVQQVPTPLPSNSPPPSYTVPLTAAEAAIIVASCVVVLLLLMMACRRRVKSATPAVRKA